MSVRKPLRMRNILAMVRAYPTFRTGRCLSNLFFHDHIQEDQTLQYRPPISHGEIF